MKKLDYSQKLDVQVSYLWLMSEIIKISLRSFKFCKSCREKSLRLKDRYQIVLKLPINQGKISKKQSLKLIKQIQIMTEYFWWEIRNYK